MIILHKLNGSEIVINAELIESLEPGRETTVNLATSNRFVVRESVEEITRQIIEYRRQVNAQAKAVNPIKGFERT